MKQRAERRLAAILAADVADYHSRIDADLGATLRALEAAHAPRPKNLPARRGGLK